MARTGKRQESCVVGSIPKARPTGASIDWTFTFDVWPASDSAVPNLFEAAEAVLMDVLGSDFSRLSRSFKIESVEHQKSKADPDWHIATIRISDEEVRMEIEMLFGAETWS